MLINGGWGDEEDAGVMNPEPRMASDLSKSVFVLFEISVQ